MPETVVNDRSDYRATRRNQQLPPPTPPPDTLAGSLTEVRLGAKVPQAAAWLERDLATPESLTAEDAAWPGQLISYRVEFRGFGSAKCPVKWTLLDAATGERVVDNQYGWKTVHATAYPDSKWEVEATEEDANVGLMWIPYVAPGTFVVEVELLDPSGVHLDIERTPPFTVLEGTLPV
ncbi:MAG: hypothetical protein K0R44_2185 [Thermomicrobiales bacterium]|nr:hypothetical protein [Thermomicrobiales bacterium]